MLKKILPQKNIQIPALAVGIFVKNDKDINYSLYCLFKTQLLKEQALQKTVRLTSSYMCVSDCREILLPASCKRLQPKARLRCLFADLPACGDTPKCCSS